MRLVKQFRLLKRNHPHLKIESQAAGTAVIIKNSSNLRISAHELIQVPSLTSAVRALLAVCPHSEPNEPWQVSVAVFTQVSERVAALAAKVQILHDVLVPLVGGPDGHLNFLHLWPVKFLHLVGPRLDS